MGPMGRLVSDYLFALGNELVGQFAVLRLRILVQETVGLVLVFALMILANGNDIIKLFR